MANAWESAPVVSSPGSGWQSAPVVNAAPQGYRDAGAPPPAVPVPQETPVSKALQFWRGLKDASSTLAHGVTAPVRAVSQAADYAAAKLGQATGGAVGYTPDRYQAILAQNARDEAEAAKTKSRVWGGGALEMAGQVAPAILAAPLVAAAGAAPAVTEAIPAVSRLVQAGQAARTGAVMAALTPVEGEFSPGAKAQQVAVGGALGAVTPALTEGAGAAITKGVNAIKGKIQPGAQALRNLAAEWGVPLSAADEGAGTRKLEGAVGDVPLTGMWSWLKDQKGKAGEAAQKLKAGLDAQMKAVGWEGLDDVIAQAKGSGDRAKEAQRLLRSVADANESGDWSTVLQTSGGMKVFGNKLKSDALYGQAEQLAPTTRMPFPKTLSAIQDLRNQIQSTPGASSQSKGILSYLDALEGDLDPMSPKGTMDLTYGGFGKLRSSLRNMKQTANAGTGDLAGTEAGAMFGRLQSAVEGDQAAFAEAKGGQFAQTRKAADRFYAENVVPYKDKAIANALKDAPADEVFQKFVLKGGLEDRAKDFYSMLDPKGQAAIRAGLVDRAIDESTKTGNFSPDAFANFMRSYRGGRNALFQGQDKWSLDGFTKLMQAISGSAAFNQASANGRMAGTVGLVGTAVANPLLAGKLVAGGAAMKQLFTTTAGKNLLLSASDLTPGSKAMTNLIETQLPKVLGVSAGRVGSSTASAPENPNDVSPTAP